MEEGKINISLIEYTGKENNNLRNILNSINGYLLRNKGAVSDFNLVKDIVDRNIDKEDDEISNNLPIPLYLGLIGTMLGIIIGLMYMPSVAEIGNNAPQTEQTINNEQVQQSVSGAEAVNNENTEDQETEADRTMEGVDILLSGVKIAMIASVSGLILTTLSSFLFFRVRRRVEHQKHDFFTFIQTRLLPILSQNTSTSIYSLQANLAKFNQDFSYNMGEFSDIIKEVKKTFDSQLEVVQELKRLDIENIVKYNVEVMQQMKSSFKNLQKLSEYLENMNGFLGSTKELNLAVNQQLQTVGQISEIVKRFDSNAETISDNSAYLTSHFKNFDSREQAIKDRIADFDQNTADAVSNLQISFNKRLQEFNNKDVEISSGFEKLFEDLRKKTKEVFDDESSNITTIKKDVDQLKNVSTELSALNQKVLQQDSTIRELLDIIKDKPVQMKQSKVITIGSIVLASVGTITCAGILYKLFFS